MRSSGLGGALEEKNHRDKKWTPCRDINQNERDRWGHLRQDTGGEVDCGLDGWAEMDIHK